MKKSLLVCSILMTLLMLAACAPDSTASSGEESAPSGVFSEREPTVLPDPELSPPPAPLATGDYAAFLRFLRSARSAQVFALDDDRMGYTALGRVSDPTAFSGLHDVFSAAEAAPLAEFDFGAPGILRLSDITASDGRVGELWLAPTDRGADLLFEIGSSLPNQRFSLKADMTALTYQLLSPFLADASHGLLDDLCAALESGDIAALCTLTGWRDASVLAPLSELSIHSEGYKPYVVGETGSVNPSLWLLRLTVEGNGVWPAGENEWIVQLGPVGGDGGLGVARMLPREVFETDRELAQTDPAGLIGTLNLVLGPECFGRIDTLDPSLLCEAVLVRTKAVYHAGDDVYDFPGSEVRDVAARFFGIEDYSGGGTLYDPDTDMYALYGRGGAEAYTAFSASGEKDGFLEMTQNVYADRACLIPLRTLVYTLRRTASGECALLSCE